MAEKLGAGIGEAAAFLRNISDLLHGDRCQHAGAVRKIRISALA
jgi:hypothetical protein